MKKNIGKGNDIILPIISGLSSGAGIIPTIERFPS
jgi:hypothetical protein